MRELNRAQFSFNSKKLEKNKYPLNIQQGALYHATHTVSKYIDVISRVGLRFGRLIKFSESGPTVQFDKLSKQYLATKADYFWTF